MNWCQDEEGPSIAFMRLVLSSIVDCELAVKYTALLAHTFPPNYGQSGRREEKTLQTRRRCTDELNSFADHLQEANQGQKMLKHGFPCI